MGKAADFQHQPVGIAKKYRACMQQTIAAMQQWAESKLYAVSYSAAAIDVLTVGFVCDDKG